MKRLFLLLLLVGCGKTPTGPGYSRVPRCIPSYRWVQVGYWDANGLIRTDSVRVVIAYGCG